MTRDKYGSSASALGYTFFRSFFRRRTLPPPRPSRQQKETQHKTNDLRAVRPFKPSPSAQPWASQVFPNMRQDHGPKDHLDRASGALGSRAPKLRYPFFFNV